jgi:hypothetical protein
MLATHVALLALPAWEAYFIQAPLFETHATPLPQITRELQAFHSGIALRSTTNQSVLTWEYDAAYGVVSAVIPTPKNGKITWNNAGIVLQYPSDTFNTSYWTLASYQGTLSEEQAQQFVAWVRDDYNRSAPAGSVGTWAPDYSPFDVVHPDTNRTWIRSQTCNDFSFDAVAQLAALGVTSKPLVPDRKCRMILYARDPATDTADDDFELVRYWSALSTIVQQKSSANSLLAAAVLVDEFVRRRTAFVRVNGRNLRVNLVPPYARWAYEAPDDGDAKPRLVERRHDRDSRL